MSALAGKKLVLIAGQPKAGTTSLFDWLAQHPEIAAGKLKEVRFFTDPDYPLQVPVRFNGSNLEAYLELFNDPDRKVLLDASPDYIGCETPLSLPALHAESKAILIFRDPVDRMISAYRFYHARGLVPQDMSFDDYVRQQHEQGVGPSTQSAFRALDHCRQSHHVARWEQAYGDNLLVLDFAELRDSPQQVLEKVCAFIGVSTKADIALTHGNKTRSYKHPALYRAYSGVRRSLAQLTLKAPWIYRLLRPFGRAISGSLESNSTSKDAVIVSARSREIILAAAGGA